jgi:CHAD domain-containing protein
VEILPDMQAAAAGQLLLRQQLAGWRALEPAVRSGADPEALHQLRVTGRHMIAMLRIVEAAPLGGALRLRRRLQSLLRASSAARDLDVQIAEFAAMGGSGDAELQPLLEQLQRQRARQRSQLQRCWRLRTVQLFRAGGQPACHVPAARPARRRGRRTAIRHRYGRVRRQRARWQRMLPSRGATAAPGDKLRSSRSLSRRCGEPCRNSCKAAN